MQALTLYGLDKCSTCVKARQWLAERGVPHEFTDYRAHPLPAASLKDWAGVLGGWEKLVNRASLTWRNLPEARKKPASEADWLALIAEYPALVRRPLLVDGRGAVMTGFSEKKYTEHFGAIAAR